uniref:Uncharacterized protein n=1 Tax=Helianthus annuus TaxID=4232 RepID=A0A251TW34_HELAN
MCTLHLTSHTPHSIFSSLAPPPTAVTTIIHHHYFSINVELVDLEEPPPFAFTQPICHLQPQVFFLSPCASCHDAR